MEGIFQSIVTKEMGLLAAAAITLMIIIGKIPIRETKLKETKLWKDFGSFILLVVCVAGAFAPGVNEIPKSQWGSIIIFGVVATLCAHLGRKILGPIFLYKLEGKNKKE